MGCAQGKCCCYYQPSSAGDARDSAELMPFRVYKGDCAATTGSADVPSHGLSLRYSYLTQRGHYPDSPGRENQDSCCIKTQFQGNPDLHFFGVFDGHGQFGAQCASLVREHLVNALSADPRLAEEPVKAYNSSFQATNVLLHESEIDDAMSGTTAITVLVKGDTLYVANVGDSRAVAGGWNGNSVVAEELSHDQTPFRKDEYERVRQCGARVLSVDQVEGIKDPDIQSWGDEESDEGDPPRLWVQHGMYPGTAFTRSVGDLTAESIGVVADPEIMAVKITPNHLFFVLASDGVFEFLSSQAVIDMVSSFADSRDACSAIAAESYKLWLEHESRTDDITIIIVHIKDLHNIGAKVIDQSQTNTKASQVISEKGRAECRIFHQPCPSNSQIEPGSACVAPSQKQTSH